jgi:RNA polymerase sigma-70 factor (ECF subfamily)
MSVYEQKVLPHLDAAYNLAHWLTSNDHDAQDVAQEACLRAFKYFENFQGENARAWLLTIVRNTFYNWLKKNRPMEIAGPLDDEALSVEDISADTDSSKLWLTDAETVRRAIAELPVEFREVIVLREMEGLSYKEIAALSNVPIGTVMSRLARARKQLQQHLVGEPSSRRDFPVNDGAIQSAASERDNYIKALI